MTDISNELLAAVTGGATQQQFVRVPKSQADLGAMVLDCAQFDAKVPTMRGPMATANTTAGDLCSGVLRDAGMKVLKQMQRTGHAR